MSKFSPFGEGGSAGILRIASLDLEVQTMPNRAVAGCASRCEFSRFSGADGGFDSHPSPPFSAERSTAQTSVGPVAPLASSASSRGRPHFQQSVNCPSWRSSQGVQIHEARRCAGVRDAPSSRRRAGSRSAARSIQSSGQHSAGGDSPAAAPRSRLRTRQSIPSLARTLPEMPDHDDVRRMRSPDHDPPKRATMVSRFGPRRSE